MADATFMSGASQRPGDRKSMKLIRNGNADEAVPVDCAIPNNMIDVYGVGIYYGNDKTLIAAHSLEIQPFEGNPDVRGDILWAMGCRLTQGW